MRRLTSGFLFLGYLMLSLTAGAVLWRAGSGTGAAAAAVLATLGLLGALHAGLSVAATRRALQQELRRLKEAHRLLADAMEATQGALAELAQAVETGALSRTEALSHEVRMLDGLVQQMSRSIDDKFEVAARAATPLLTPSVRLLQTIHDALAENRADLYLQPVVSLPQRRTLYYESFTRLRDADNRVLTPAQFLSTAEGEGLVPAIDNLLLFRSAQIVRRLAAQDRRVGVFCNISLASLGDEVFFPQFLDFLEQNRDLSASLIFELGQATFGARGAQEARNMAKLADLGFRFSIDKVQTLELDFVDLQRSDVRFVKVGADLLIEQLLDPGRPGGGVNPISPDIHAGDFARMLSRHGLELIAEKLETEKQVIDILELEIGLGQGHLFGEPRAIREAVLSETGDADAHIRSTIASAGKRLRAS
jgi:cyclic-di-GMP phosphodiesterase TipF (flagellum assembly factor)